MQNQARNKVINCGRRFGKTVLALAKIFEEGLSTPDSSFFYVAPTYKQAKMIAWEMIVKAYENLPEDLKVKKNESDLFIKFRDIEHKGISTIAVKGADYPDSLRGVRLNGCVLDEYATMKKNVYEEIIRASLIDMRGWCWFIGTPKGKNHFYDLYNFALQQNNEDWSAFHFTTYDNPFIPKDEIDKAKEQMNEDYFRQEFMAEFTSFSGLIYKDFKREINVIDPIDISLFQKYRGIDFGATNPFAVTWIAVDGDDNWYVYKEHYKANQTTKFHAELINNNSIGERYVATYQDPSAKQLQLDLAEFGIYTIPANNCTNINDNNSGILKIQEKLKVQPLTGKPKLFIFKNCENVIKEFESYQWDSDSENNLLNRPKKENDHLLDSLKYVMNSYSPRKTTRAVDEFFQNTKRTQSNRFTGY